MCYIRHSTVKKNAKILQRLFSSKNRLWFSGLTNNTESFGNFHSRVVLPDASVLPGVLLGGVAEPDCIIGAVDTLLAVFSQLQVFPIFLELHFACFFGNASYVRVLLVSHKQVVLVTLEESTLYCEQKCGVRVEKNGNTLMTLQTKTNMKYFKNFGVQKLKHTLNPKHGCFKI